MSSCGGHHFLTAVKQDAEELKDIATGDGSLADKAKAAAEALQDPGAAGAVVRRLGRVHD